MKSSIFKIIFILLLSVILISCGETEDENKNEDENPGVYVKVDEVNSQFFTDYIDIIGVAKAYQLANISSDEGGRIEKFVNDKGSYVKKNEVIVELENDVLKANLDAAEARYKLAEINFQKQEEIYKDSVSSEIQYLNSKYERDRAKADYEIIKTRYEKTFIKAPFAGIIDKKFVEIGELVAPTSPIVSLVSMGIIKVEAGVPEKHVNKIHKGDNVVVIFPDLDNAEYNAKVTYVGHTINESNRTFPVEINLNNSNGKIKPELNAKIHIETGIYEDVFLIPEEVVTQTDEGEIVFVYKKGLAEMRYVDVISRKNNKAAVQNGLNNGDSLIVVGYSELVDGEKVTITE